LKIFVQCCLGNQSSDIGKGEMVSAFDRMPSRWSFVQVAGINPGERGGHHAKVQVVLDRHRISILGFGTADILFKFFETGFYIPVLRHL
jgi:hypothetical protein